MRLSGASACFVSPTEVTATRVRAGGSRVYQSPVSLRDLPRRPRFWHSGKSGILRGCLLFCCVTIRTSIIFNKKETNSIGAGMRLNLCVTTWTQEAWKEQQLWKDPTVRDRHSGSCPVKDLFRSIYYLNRKQRNLCQSYRTFHLSRTFGSFHLLKGNLWLFPLSGVKYHFFPFPFFF